MALAFVFASSFGISCQGLGTAAATTKTIISVCTGPDCRVDGSASCMRQLQKSVKAIDAGTSDSGSDRTIRVTGRNCVGPCGDGPCVMILDATNDNERIAVDQPSKQSISLAPPDVFGSNPKGWYQVRTKLQLEEVMGIACESAGIPFERTSTIDESGDELIIEPTRKVYDRPRNERKVLQRLMQVMVLAGFYGIEGEPSQLQYGIGVALFILSNLIMKENILEFLWKKFTK